MVVKVVVVILMIGVVFGGDVCHLGRDGDSGDGDFVGDDTYGCVGHNSCGDDGGCGGQTNCLAVLVLMLVVVMIVMVFVIVVVMVIVVILLMAVGVIVVVIVVMVMVIVVLVVKLWLRW